MSSVVLCSLTCLRDKVIIFSGGMPRASYGDRHTVTIMQGNDRHVVFDLSSRVVDFVVLTRADEADIDESPAGNGRPVRDRNFRLMFIR